MMCSGVKLQLVMLSFFGNVYTEVNGVSLLNRSSKHKHDWGTLGNPPHMCVLTEVNTKFMKDHLMPTNKLDTYRNLLENYMGGSTKKPNVCEMLYAYDLNFDTIYQKVEALLSTEIKDYMMAEFPRTVTVRLNAPGEKPIATFIEGACEELPDGGLVKVKSNGYEGLINRLNLGQDVKLYNNGGNKLFGTRANQYKYHGFTCVFGMANPGPALHPSVLYGVDRVIEVEEFGCNQIEIGPRLLPNLPPLHNLQQCSVFHFESIIDYGVNGWGMPVCDAQGNPYEDRQDNQGWPVNEYGQRVDCRGRRLDANGAPM